MPYLQPSRRPPYLHLQPQESLHFPWVPSSSHRQTAIPWSPSPEPLPSTLRSRPPVSHHHLLSWPSPSQMDPQERFPLLGSLNPGPSHLLSPSKNPLTFANSLSTPVSVPTGSRPCNQPRCKTCSIHHPVNSFTSSHTNVAYPITTHADCKSINLIYHLKCTECNAFYIGDTHRSLSDCMNGHWFTTAVSNPDLRVAIHTKSHQIPFQKCWSVSVIHKLPDSTPDHIRHQVETAYQLVLQS